MTVRIPALFLLALLVAVPAASGQDLRALEDEFLEKVARDLPVDERTALVDRVAAHPGSDGADLLLEGASKISEAIDEVRKELAKVEAKHAPLNTNQDVGKDDFKTRTALRERIDELDRIILSHGKVVDAIGTALAAREDEGARAVVQRAATRGDSWRTRRIAAAAAALYPTEGGRTAAIRALKDKDARVVVATLDALGRRADEATVEDVAKALDHEAWVVTVAAAQALGNIGSTKAVRPLVAALGKTEGRVQSDINEALKRLTGQEFPPDYEQWKRYYEENKAELDGEGARPLGGRGGEKNPADDPSYYGIQTKSRRIVYVIDISGSMNLEIGGKGTSTPRPGEEEQVSGPKIHIAKTDLKNAIRKLPEDAKFNIITFNHLVKVWKPSLVDAKQSNKNDAYIFINELEASGSTYTYGALKEAFRLAGMGANDPEYESGVDTIFLLSDGAPTDQAYPTSALMEPSKILDAVRQWNQLGKIVIHAIAIDAQTQGGNFIRFMKDLAEQNGGQYTERG